MPTTAVSPVGCSPTPIPPISHGIARAISTRYETTKTRSTAMLNARPIRVRAGGSAVRIMCSPNSNQMKTNPVRINTTIVPGQYTAANAARPRGFPVATIKAAAPTTETNAVVKPNQIVALRSNQTRKLSMGSMHGSCGDSPERAGRHMSSAMPVCREMSRSSSTTAPTSGMPSRRRIVSASRSGSPGISGPLVPGAGRVLRSVRM